MTTSITFSDNFATKNGNDNYHHLFQWFYCDTFLHGGGVVKKAMATSNLFLFFFSHFGLVH
jgi:hypothetical protein